MDNDLELGMGNLDDTLTPSTSAELNRVSNVFPRTEFRKDWIPFYGALNAQSRLSLRKDARNANLRSGQKITLNKFIEGSLDKTYHAGIELLNLGYLVAVGSGLYFTYNLLTNN
ncbi:hypothetical protein CMI38_04040 [Candidatus Pacearchaeota archaeon]|jgi:hypothetical protein|nr:hypothetical protein [Candidatus Pacearchaeota archaeon]|tara:strand:+ start:630 stop:971 length:342 start_codon:yes stop_codon:yes gene_type:complete